ncbi:MAG: thiamine pyrophosphate-dependent dehydrogenase E1 component subunit alpha [Candidatus Dormibacteria bacterium]
MAVAETDATNREGLDAGTLRTFFRHMLRSRVLDERMWVLNRQGRAPFWISAMGHEAIQVAIGMNMRPDVDWLAPYYRDLALTLVLGMTPRDHLLSVLAKAEDPNSGGRQMPAHYGCRAHNIISTGSPVTTQLLHAAGIALAHKLRGEDAVCVTAFGEGSTSGGDFHEAMNFAATHRLPVVFVVENNGYAISVPLDKQMPTPRVSDRAQAYGIPGVHVDGNDAIACYRAAETAMARARDGEGPTLLEARVHRLTSHSSDDDQRRYRTAEDLEAERRLDCLPHFRSMLEDLGILGEGEYETIRAELVAEVDEATAYAETAADPDPRTVFQHVYGEDA